MDNPPVFDSVLEHEEIATIMPEEYCVLGCAKLGCIQRGESFDAVRAYQYRYEKKEMIQVWIRRRHSSGDHEAGTLSIS